jgi:hypothetical protein
MMTRRGLLLKGSVKMTLSPPPMDTHQKMRLRTAAFRVTRLYPGPVGELLSRELQTWEEFGYRLGGSQLVMRLVDFVMKEPIENGESRKESYERFKSAVGY